MERWQGKVAVVTGASSGIGSATVISLVKSGMIVVGLARRVEKVEQLKDNLPIELQKNLYAKKCDVSVEQEIVDIFKWIETTFNEVHVLVNNAGIARRMNLTAAENILQSREIIDTNVMGVIYCSREAFQIMKKHNIDGHIIHINSICGHHVLMMTGDTSSNAYHASKFAVTALTETMRQEFMKQNTKVKITSLSPGAVKTEIFGDKIPDIAMLDAEDIANGVLYVLSTPAHVQVHELTIKPIGEMF